MADAVVNVDELYNKACKKLIDQFVSRKAIIYNDLDRHIKFKRSL